MRSFSSLAAKRHSFGVYPLVLGFILLFILKAQTLWVSGSVNLFNRELLQVWHMEPVELTQTICQPGRNMEAVQQMAGWLENSSAGPKPALAFRQGQLACLEGQLQEAQAAWRQASETSTLQPAALLLLTSSLFAQGQVMETSRASEVGHYGYLRGRGADREDDVSKAADWYRFSLTYAPVINTANYLERLYHSQGEGEQVKELWLGLTQSAAADTPLYWWAKGKVAEAEQEWMLAGKYYYEGAQRGDVAETYQALVQSGMMWYRVEAYEQAQTVLHQALSIGLVQRTVDLDGQQPYYWLGKVAYTQMQYDEALNYFNQALTLDPTSSSYLYEKAVTLQSMGQRVEAVGVLTSAIDHHQNPPQQWRVLLESWQKCLDGTEPEC